MSEKQQRLVLAIIDFLNQSVQDGTVKRDDKEGLEVAVQCIGEAFGIDPNDSQQRGRLEIQPDTLIGVFEQFLKSRDQMNTGKSTEEPSTSTQPSAADKAEAEVFKAKGNQLMSKREYDDAIEAYTQAIARDGTNPVYYSNRAAAHSSRGSHPDAIVDAEKAIDIDPAFSKAYHRLGHANYSLGNYSESASAFKRGLEIDPSNMNMKTGLENAEARADVSTPQSAAAAAASTTSVSEPSSAGASAGRAGGIAGAGGLGDMFGNIMQNPELMRMAQQMAANGGLASLMRNPSVANMMSRMQSGNMPSMQEIMTDPNLRQFASQFAGRGGGGAPPSSSP